MQLGCHSSFSLNPDARGKIELLGVPDNYIPGQRYTLTFRITHPDSDRRRWGFQVTAVETATFLPAGELEVTDQRNTQKIDEPSLGGRQYISHTFLGTGQGRTGGFSWTFGWTAPAPGRGDVAFYGSGNAANGDSTPLGDKIYNPTPRPLAVAKGQFLFVERAAQAGVASSRGSGVAVGDFDGDGFPDIYLARAGQDLLFRNRGDGSFVEVAQTAGIREQEEGRAAAWGDFDGDGRLDLYVVNVGSDVLYRNNGDGTFTDVSAQAGIGDATSGRAVVWADFDGDGYRDLYVVNEGQDLLYWNNGNGTFTRADPDLNGLKEQAAGWGVAVADYNGDGRLDLFVANEGQSFLYRNNGDRTFSEVAVVAGIHTAGVQGRGAAWGDFDKDERPDLFLVAVGQDFLFRNKGDGTFEDVTARARVADTAIGAVAVWADYDRDGDLDLFVGNDGQDFLYRNNGDGTFNEVARFSGMTDEAVAQSAAWADFDGDGNVDLFVSNADGNFLYRNPGRSGTTSSNAWVPMSERGLGLWLVDLLQTLKVRVKSAYARIARAVGLADSGGSR